LTPVITEQTACHDRVDPKNRGKPVFLALFPLPGTGTWVRGLRGGGSYADCVGRGPATKFNLYMDLRENGGGIGLLGEESVYG
jgi:hypothetical protein